MSPVADPAHPRILTCDADETLGDVARRMREAHASFAVVVRGGAPVGLVTKKQLAMRASKPDARALKEPVERVMTFRGKVERTPAFRKAAQAATDPARAP